MAIHVIPAEDREHVLDGGDCCCGPDMEYLDPETELPYQNGPLVMHHPAGVPDAEHVGWAIREVR